MNFIPTRPPAVRPVRVTEFALGMPHLVPNGLSETWLLKQLGHIHWLMLAEILERKPSQVTDTQGRRVYAAFRQLDISGAEFHRAREDGFLEIVSTLSRSSRTQVLSQHDVFLDRHAAGSIQLVSAFIRRDQEGSNRKVNRIDVEGLEALPWSQDFQMKPVGADYGDSHDLAGRFTFKPCPHEDFNGAGFLYFSSYIALMERALWQWRPAYRTGFALSKRSVSYFGNIDIGDEIGIDIFDPCSETDSNTKYLLVKRKNDDGIIARAIVQRNVHKVDRNYSAV